MGGFVDPNESFESALQRELKEELGIDISETAMAYLCSEPNVYEYKGVTYQTCDAVFVVRLEEKVSVKVEKQEVARFAWRLKREIRIEDVAFDSLRRALVTFLALS